MPGRYLADVLAEHGLSLPPRRPAVAAAGKATLADHSSPPVRRRHLLEVLADDAGAAVGFQAAAGPSPFGADGRFITAAAAPPPPHPHWQETA